MPADFQSDWRVMACQSGYTKTDWEDAGQSGRGDFPKYLQVQCSQSLSGLYYPVQTVMTETKREQH